MIVMGIDELLVEVFTMPVKCQMSKLKTEDGDRENREVRRGEAGRGREEGRKAG